VTARMKAEAPIRIAAPNATGIISTTSTTPTTNYAKESNQLRNLHEHDADRTPEGAGEKIDELVHRRQDVDIARQ